MSEIGNPTLMSLGIQLGLDAASLCQAVAVTLLDECHLAFAGQGMNRVQQAPNVSKAIHNILWRCQHKIGSWVGSSVRDTLRCYVMLLLPTQGLLVGR